MNSGPRWVWWLVGCCAIAALGTLAWATWHALRLEQREAEARAVANQQESIRLALWRMETQLAPLLAREASRPYFHYAAFYPADRAYTNLYEEVKPGEVMVPSPLLDGQDPFVLLHFQHADAGDLTSPEAPTGNMRDLAESQYVSSDRVIEATRRLGLLNNVLKAPLEFKLRSAHESAEQSNVAGGLAQSQQNREPTQQSDATEPDASAREFGARQQAIGQVLSSDARDRRALADTETTRTPSDPKNQPVSADQPRTEAESKEAGAAKPGLAPAVPAPVEPSAFPGTPERARKSIAERTESDGDEQRGRSAGAAESDTISRKDKSGAKLDDRPGPGGGSLAFARKDVMIGELKPVWRTDPATGGPALILLREVAAGQLRLYQGCWIDWPALRASLLANTADLLPQAQLEPVDDAIPPAAESLGRRLAGIAAELVPGSFPAPVVAPWSPMKTTLIFTWVAALLSVGAIGAALRAASDLAERRGQFVSAVTHELRTPLTTFCLYSQMLADGMVPDDGSRRDYLSTLKAESQRLARIVENVLEYARLGRKRERRVLDRTPVSTLIERLTPVLRSRAEQAGLVFSIEARQACGNAHVRIDSLTVERILFNLVDNACKYASGGPDPRVSISADVTELTCVMTIKDHGPGIDPSVMGSLFKPFSRAQTLAHASTPGLGLGLALCRGLARQVAGDLVLVRSDASGTTFELTLPLDRSSGA